MKKLHGDGDTIRIGLEIQCIPYAGFFLFIFNFNCFQLFCIGATIRTGGDI